jgi:hypothetical protein
MMLFLGQGFAENDGGLAIVGQHPLPSRPPDDLHRHAAMRARGRFDGRQEMEP